jgi:hypothetical protein
MPGSSIRVKPGPEQRFSRPERRRHTFGKSGHLRCALGVTDDAAEDPADLAARMTCQSGP